MYESLRGSIVIRILATLFNLTTIVSDVNDCASNPCMNGGHCIDLKDNFQCQCKEGFWGKFCELEVDNCALQPCKNNGTCINKVFNKRRSFYFCCLFGFFFSICIKYKWRAQLKKHQIKQFINICYDFPVVAHGPMKWIV